MVKYTKSLVSAVFNGAFLYSCGLPLIRQSKAFIYAQTYYKCYNVYRLGVSNIKCNIRKKVPHCVCKAAKVATNASVDFLALQTIF